jgi:hypothetical protein
MVALTLLPGTAAGSGDVRSGCLKGSQTELWTNDGRQFTMRLVAITRTGGRVERAPERCRPVIEEHLNGRPFTLRVPVAASRVVSDIGCFFSRGAQDGGTFGNTVALGRHSPRRWHGTVMRRDDSVHCVLTMHVRSVRGDRVRTYEVEW